MSLNTSVQKGRRSYVLPYIAEEAKRSGCPAMLSKYLGNKKVAAHMYYNTLQRRRSVAAVRQCCLNTSVQKGHGSYVLPYITEEAKHIGCPAMLSKYLGTKRSRLICITIYCRGGEA